MQIGWIIFGAVSIWGIWKYRSILEGDKLSRRVIFANEDLSYRQRKRLNSGPARLYIVAGFLTMAVSVASVYWGLVVPQQDASAISNYEQTWIRDFRDRHHEHWDETCDAIFFRLNTVGELVRDGQTYNVQWCQSLWTPPATPTEYSSSDFDQPESAEPHTSVAVFGPETSWVYCSGSECLSWDTFSGP